MVRSRLSQPVMVGIVAAGLAALFLVMWVGTIPQPTPEYFPPGESHGFVSTYDPPTRPIEVTADSGDGQAFAALAMDPLLSRPEVFDRGPSEAAYRTERPLASYLAWALTVGRPGPVPYALGFSSVVGVGLFAAMTASLARRAGRDPRLALLLVAAPGVVADLRWLCPDVLAAGLGLAGLVLWLRYPRRTAAAIACFTLAALTRETLLVIPFVVGVDALMNRIPLRRLLGLVIPPAVFVAWVAVVHARFGSWPFDAAGQSRLGLPLVGLVQGLPRASTVTLVALAVSALLVAIALLHRPEPILRRMIFGHLALASLMGQSVWESWHGFGRIMLPLVGVAVALAAPTEAVAKEAVEKADRRDLAVT